MKTAIYTIVTNDYDNVQPIDAPCDCYLFTDDPKLSVKGWITVHTKLNQRHLKINPFISEILCKYGQTIYMDGNLQMLAGAFYSILSLLDDKDFITTKHPERNCVYAEIQRCSQIGKDDLDRLDTIRYQLLEIGVESNAGMIAAAFLARKNTEAVRSFCKNWMMAHILLQGKRDQISYGLAQHVNPFEPYLLPFMYTFRALFLLSGHKINKPK